MLSEFLEYVTPGVIHSVPTAFIITVGMKRVRPTPGVTEDELPYDVSSLQRPSTISTPYTRSNMTLTIQINFTGKMHEKEDHHFRTKHLKPPHTIGVILTHISLASSLWDIGKQYRPRSAAT